MHLLNAQSWHLAYLFEKSLSNLSLEFGTLNQILASKFYLALIYIYFNNEYDQVCLKMYFLDFNKTPKEKAWQKLCKDATWCF